MSRRNVNMLSGSVTRGLISMILPIMISNVMQSVFSAIDMTVLKRYSNDLAVGAVGACSNLISLSTALLLGISIGSNMVVARRALTFRIFIFTEFFFTLIIFTP